ncbi:major capsid protein [Neisseria meningitidis]|uniref:major capsid protein n=1 Tax=Neisseria meningitidis TaxID=487 RepID=UPI0034D67DCB
MIDIQPTHPTFHSEEERDYVMQRYHDVISSFGGKTSNDAQSRSSAATDVNLRQQGADVERTD